MDLANKKAVALGERDGVSGEAIADCLRTQVDPAVYESRVGLVELAVDGDAVRDAMKQVRQRLSVGGADKASRSKVTVVSESLTARPCPTMEKEVEGDERACQEGRTRGWTPAMRGAK